ncbi:hypothetical protein XIS1_1340005 [Xenorhabdus innexi]|uniref:Uncharacterized protein n=1 Tax=Xenorhabdus innexi TaxID=290109 RepID=A0A1N6MTB3_9GAMM|nr:hypothetical protein XIS1_1340005 [Xenorhabdus innexi]
MLFTQMSLFSISEILLLQETITQNTGALYTIIHPYTPTFVIAFCPLGSQRLLLDIEWADTITVIIFSLIHIKESVT